MTSFSASANILTFSSGISISLIPKDIPDRVAYLGQYSSGLVTDGERYNKVVDIWSHANEKVAKVMMDALGTDKVLDDDGSVLEQKSFNFSASANILTFSSGISISLIPKDIPDRVAYLKPRYMIWSARITVSLLPR
jgi:hypothetical protein